MMPKAPRTTERTSDIVRAAAQLFALQGYHRTSTREIAFLADVSENTLFRHFDRKEDLFWSALRSHSTGLKLGQSLVDGLASCEKPEIIFPQIVDLLIDAVTFKPDLLRLIGVAFVELHPKADAFRDEYLSPILSGVHRYLVKSIEGGRIRDLDSVMSTIAMVMTVLLHSSLSKFVDGYGTSHFNRRNAAHEYTEFWLEMLASSTPAHARPSPPTAG
jgi:AcrR family transcriptional regulator